MLRNLIIIVGSIITATLSLTYLVSCGAEVAEPEYADSITEGILQAINQEDYAQFIIHFDENIKKIMPETNFHHTVADITSRVGKYQSKEFLKAESSRLVTIVYYKGKFTLEPEDVIIEIRFKESGGKIYITSFTLDSPKLRGN